MAQKQSMLSYQLKPHVVSAPRDGELVHYESQTRFDICDLEGNVIDDAQGYGYKSAQSAHRAAAYRFKGGAKKANTAKAFWRKNKVFGEKLLEVLLINVKTPPSDEALLAFAVEQGVEGFEPKFVKYLPR